MLKHLLLHKIKRERNIKKRRCHTLETQEERLYEKASEPRREIYRISQRNEPILYEEKGQNTACDIQQIKKGNKCIHFSV